LMAGQASALTLLTGLTRIAAVRSFARYVGGFTLALAVAGCGIAYQAGTRIKASHMADSIQVGETSSEIHERFGEPTIRDYQANESEIWSYPYKPNSNDIVAGLLYTSTKDGDKGTFLDLKFVNGKLVSWTEAEHTTPAKERAGFGVGLGGGPPIGGGPGSPGSVHY
jgi:hypothetical protein